MTSKNTNHTTYELHVMRNVRTLETAVLAYNTRFDRWHVLATTTSEVAPVESAAEAAYRMTHGKTVFFNNNQSRTAASEGQPVPRVVIGDATYRQKQEFYNQLLGRFLAAYDLCVNPDDEVQPTPVQTFARRPNHISPDEWHTIRNSPRGPILPGELSS